MGVFYSIDFSLPLTNPVLKFLIILLIILVIPVLFNRLRAPSILGLILAGAVIGPFGLNLIERDSGIILSGTAGLLYIMFLAGLEVDMGDFKKNKGKSIVFGLYTFSIPMLFGILGGYYILNFSILSSVLLASMFASHTLIAYPIIRKLGIARNIAVNITVGGTIITDTLALLVLAVIVGMTKGEVGSLFWLKLTFSVLVFGFTVLFVFPIVGRWFFRKIEDNVAQYIFVLVMVFLAAFLAELAGVEGIIGAFLAGLSLNRLIPRNSALMNRVEFVGNAIFIPFFLIGIGMLINYKLFFEDEDTLIVGGVMILIATSSKYLAAYFTQRTFKFSNNERLVIFGLSNAQAAATLAAVLIGYNVILGQQENGEPIRLLNESVLNGTILMILFTCTLATISAAKGGKGILISEAGKDRSDEPAMAERILISVKNINNVEELINLAILLKSGSNTELFALNVLDNKKNDLQDEKMAQQLLSRASEIAIASNDYLFPVLRYDSNFKNGILSAVRENRITDILLGLHVKEKLSDSFLGDLTEEVLANIQANTFIYKSYFPINTIKRHLVFLPEGVENDTGFPTLLNKIWQLGRNSGAKINIYGTERCLEILEKVRKDYTLESEFFPAGSQNDILKTLETSKEDDNVVMVFRSKKVSSRDFFPRNIKEQLIETLNTKSFILAYIYNDSSLEKSSSNLMDASVIGPVEKLDDLFRQISGLFRKTGK
ncbi:transporter (CPA2 family) [Christiangramia gaetbulicola]|uniref:Transporter (CPA2 family) n=2 Tax=Christiangramia gaetbulicola TaxID=703340 RepID=A0A2T6AJP2_9FLAO|nr:transporter (CPA2 family) [Christiangramia gaetbulicola]